jgi:hypothetical protein
MIDSLAIIGARLGNPTITAKTNTNISASLQRSEKKKKQKDDTYRIKSLDVLKVLPTNEKRPWRSFVLARAQGGANMQHQVT